MDESTRFRFIPFTNQTTFTGTFSFSKQVAEKFIGLRSLILTEYKNNWIFVYLENSICLHDVSFWISPDRTAGLSMRWQWHTCPPSTTCWRRRRVSAPSAPRLSGGLWRLCWTWASSPPRPSSCCVSAAFWPTWASTYRTCILKVSNWAWLISHQLGFWWFVPPILLNNTGRIIEFSSRSASLSCC